MQRTKEGREALRILSETLVQAIIQRSATEIAARDREPREPMRTIWQHHPSHSRAHLRLVK